MIVHVIHYCSCLNCVRFCSQQQSLFLWMSHCSLTFSLCLLLDQIFHNLNLFLLLSSPHTVTHHCTDTTTHTSTLTHVHTDALTHTHTLVRACACVQTQQNLMLHHDDSAAFVCFTKVPLKLKRDVSTKLS